MLASRRKVVRGKGNVAPACRGALSRKQGRFAVVSRPTGLSGLNLIYQDKLVRLYARPDFDPSRFEAFALDRVEVQTASSLDSKQKAEQEQLGTDLEAQITKLLTKRDSASRLSMYIRLHDIESVMPAINIATLAHVFLPLDTGAMTVETTYRDSAGYIQARRIERLNGSVFNIKASFSAYGQHKLILSEWAQRCPMSVACLSKPGESFK